MSAYDPADGSDPPTAAPAPPCPPGHRDLVRQQVDEDFSAFYRANIRTLVGFLINHGASMQAATDIAQGTMTDAYRRWADITHPKAWVHKAASRALAREVASVEEPVEVVPEPSSLLPRPDGIAEWEAQHDALPLLRSLPPRQRQIMAWTLTDFTPSDIADHLGLPAETVRANLKKARHAAAIYLKAREEEQ